MEVSGGVGGDSVEAVLPVPEQDLTAKPRRQGRQFGDVRCTPVCGGAPAYHRRSVYLVISLRSELTCIPQVDRVLKVGVF